MQLDLIDDYWLFVNPVLLGKGIPVFDNIQETTKLKLIATHAFSSGVVCLHYERKKE
jgi:dihydrofolate reductase